MANTSIQTTSNFAFKDQQVIMTILKEMQIHDYEEAIIKVLLEFLYKYITSILVEAKTYAKYNKKEVIDVHDVRLAIKMQLDLSFSNMPSKRFLEDIAATKNNINLPLIKKSCGLKIPPDQYCLSECNYLIKMPDFVKKNLLKLPRATRCYRRTVKTSKLNFSNVKQTFKVPIVTRKSTSKSSAAPKTNPKIKTYVNNKLNKNSS